VLLGASRAINVDVENGASNTSSIAVTTIAPPQPSHDEVEALIEEARQRARRRRLITSVAALAVATAAVAVGTIIAMLSSGAGGRTAPAGLRLVKAQGPVTHAVLDWGSYGGTWRMIDVAGGQDRLAKFTEEIWYDPRSGLWRDLFRVEGRTKSDLAGRCRPAPKQVPCASDVPLKYLRPFPWPPSRSGLREKGPGLFRGHSVIWLEPRDGLRAPPIRAVSQIGLDPLTHRIVVERSFVGGRLVGTLAILQKPNLPAEQVGFLLPADSSVPVAPHPFYDPWAGLVFDYRLPAARKALGRPPLWLGPRFRGHALNSVTSGVYRPQTAGVSGPRPVRFVRFYYGGDVRKGAIISIEEFGSVRPSFEKQGPRPGSIERTGTTSARLTSSGLLLRINTDLRYPLTRANAIALAKALRPLLGGVKTVATLRQQQ
jgi:hypothetical protein